MSFEDFYLLSSANLYTALCTLFKVEHIPKWQIDKLNSKISQGQLSLAKLYLIHTTDSFYNSLSKIVRADWFSYPHSSFNKLEDKAQ